jgi:hypothetical protein
MSLEMKDAKYAGEDELVQGLRVIAHAAQMRPRLDDDAMIARAMLAGAARHRRRRVGRVVLVGVGALAIAAAALIAFQPVSPTLPIPPPMTSMHLPSGDALTAREGTRFHVEADTPRERRVRIDRGAMLFDVAPLGEGSSFEARTPHLTVHVVGTVFEVVVGEHGTLVHVFEGRVRIEGTEELIDAGEHIAVGRAPALDARLAEQGRTAAEQRTERAPEPIPAHDTPEARVDPAPIPIAPQPPAVTPARPEEPSAREASRNTVSGSEPSAPEPRSDAEPSEPSATDRPAGPREPAGRVASDGPVSDGPVSDGPVAFDAPEGPARVELVELRRLLVSGDARRALELVPRARAQGTNEGELSLVEADALRALGRASEAASRYDAAARALPAGERETAGYLAARLRLLSLRDPRGALDSLEESGAMAPGSPLAERATALAVDAYEALQRTSEARAAARDYLERFPHGSSVEQMRRLLGP